MSNPVAYGVSKAGLTQLTRSLATVLSPSIRVNAIALGGIFVAKMTRLFGGYIDRTPLKRMASEDDLIWATIFLCTPMSSYMTTNLTVDGGFGVWYLVQVQLRFQPRYRKISASPLVFIDGITRCGKSSLSGILPSLTNMEHIQFSTILELVVPGLFLQKLDTDYAKIYNQNIFE